MGEGGWVLLEFSESPENGGREERQAPRGFWFLINYLGIFKS